QCTRVQARDLFIDIVEFQVQFGMILSTNKSISFTDLDGGVERRLSIVPWPMRFTRPPTEHNVLVDRAPGLMWLLMKIARIFPGAATPLSGPAHTRWRWPHGRSLSRTMPRISRIETFTWHPMTRYRPGASIIFRSTGVV
ncbi:unnamed protein product, partial [Effrenium voratum]